MLVHGAGRRTRIGHERAREVKRVAELVHDDLDVVRIELLRRVFHAHHDGRHRQILIHLKGCDEIVDHGRLDQRLVALHVDDEVDLRVCLCHLGESIGTRRMVGARQERLAAFRSHSIVDALVVRRHDHLLGLLRAARTLQDAADHGLAADVGERLARQTRRRIARRNHAKCPHVSSPPFRKAAILSCRCTASIS